MQIEFQKPLEAVKMIRTLDFSILKTSGMSFFINIYLVSKRLRRSILALLFLIPFLVFPPMTFQIFRCYTTQDREVSPQSFCTILGCFLGKGNHDTTIGSIFALISFLAPIFLHTRNRMGEKTITLPSGFESSAESCIKNFATHGSVADSACLRISAS